MHIFLYNKNSPLPRINENLTIVAKQTNPLIFPETHTKKKKYIK